MVLMVSRASAIKRDAVALHVVGVGRVDANPFGGLTAEACRLSLHKHRLANPISGVFAVGRRQVVGVRLVARQGLSKVPEVQQQLGLAPPIRAVEDLLFRPCR